MKKQQKIPAFEIDDRITIKIELELAGHLGHLILSSIDNIESLKHNTALLAFGHQLKNISSEEN